MPSDIDVWVNSNVLECASQRQRMLTDVCFRSCRMCLEFWTCVWIALGSASHEVLRVDNELLDRGSFQGAVMIYWALRGWVVAWEFLENCVSLSWRLIPVDLYPSMPALRSASELASAVLGIVVGIWFWIFWERKGMDLAQCVYVVSPEGEVRLERGWCSTLMRNDEWDFHWSRDVWAMGNNDPDDVVNPWVVWSRAVTLSGGARTVNGERRCRLRLISGVLVSSGRMEADGVVMLLWCEGRREGEKGSWMRQLLCRNCSSEWYNRQCENATAGTSQKVPDVELVKRGSRDAPLVYVWYSTFKFLILLFRQPI